MTDCFPALQCTNTSEMKPYFQILPFFSYSTDIIGHSQMQYISINIAIEELNV